MNWLRGAVGSLLAIGITTSAAPSPQGIRGEIVDSYCFAVVGVRGPSHSACAIRCVKNGVAPIFVESGTRRVFVLTASRDAAALPPELIAQAGRQVVITGEIVARGGTNFLSVRSFRR